MSGKRRGRPKKRGAAVSEETVKSRIKSYKNSMPAAIRKFCHIQSNPSVLLVLRDKAMKHVTCPSVIPGGTFEGTSRSSHHNFIFGECHHRYDVLTLWNGSEDIPNSEGASNLVALVEAEVNEER